MDIIFLKDILRGRLGIHATSMNCRRDSAAQMTTIDATLMDTTSLGKTGSDPVDETKTRSQPEYHGKSNLLLFNTGLSLFNKICNIITGINDIACFESCRTQVVSGSTNGSLERLEHSGLGFIWQR